jgi:hypothetical protein
MMTEKATMGPRNPFPLKHVFIIELQQLIEHMLVYCHKYGFDFAYF